MIKKLLFSITLAHGLVVTFECYPKIPKLTVVFIIDQLRYQSLMNIKPYLKGGLKKFLDQGINFESAFWPHAMPSTGVGHAGLVTGTFAKNHGIIDNGWLDEKGNKTKCDDDTAERAAVFSPTGFYDYGKSAHHLMVDNVSDQLIMQSTTKKQNKVFSVSLKSRAAIMLAGNLGKALWFDQEGMQFTSSKAYFSILPPWTIQFNKNKKVDETTRWNLAYPKESKAYNSVRAMDYKYARLPQMYQTEVTQKHCLKTPFCQNLLFDLAQECLDQEFSDTLNTFVLFVSLSTLDKVGHVFGPDSIEYLDILYHLDKRLENFIITVYKRINPDDVLFILTSDHGDMPILEQLKDKGYSKTHRINKNKLITMLNKKIEKRFDVKNFIRHIDTPDIYITKESSCSLSEKTKKKIYSYIQNYLTKIPGIKKVWRQKELAKSSCESNQFEYFYKNQLFPSRSGELILQVFPYTLVSKNEKGTSHKSPYHYDTQVPLIFYQKGKLEQKGIKNSIWLPQVSATLAQLLEIPIPSAATFSALPEIV